MKSLLVFSLLAGGAKPPEGIESKGIHEPLEGLKVHWYEHTASGLNVMVVPEMKGGVVAFVTSYAVGSRNELPGRTGIAHLFEHMMFRGTPSFPNPFKTLALWGDEFNAFTSSDLTQYHVVSPKEIFPKVVQFEAERMRKLAINDEVFQTERGAVVSERKMRTEDDPNGKLWWELYQLAYDRHTYKTGPIGWQKDLDATNFDDIMKFYQTHYAPNNAFVVVAGDVTLREVLREVSKNFASFQKVEQVAQEIPQEPIRVGAPLRRKVIRTKAERVLMADSHLGYRYGDNEAAAETLTCSLLASPTHGFLYFELVETGLAQSVGQSCWPSIDPDLSTVFVVANPGVSVEKIENAYEQALKKFPAWLNEDKLRRMKLYYLASKYSSMRSPHGIAGALAQDAVTARDPFFSYKFLDRVNEVTLMEVKKQYLSWNRNRARLFVAPSK